MVNRSIQLHHHNSARYSHLVDLYFFSNLPYSKLVSKVFTIPVLEPSIWVPPGMAFAYGDDSNRYALLLSFNTNEYKSYHVELTTRFLSCKFPPIFCIFYLLLVLNFGWYNLHTHTRVPIFKSCSGVELQYENTDGVNTIGE